MSYKQMIESWHKKAKEVDYFSKFFFEYLAFIGYLKTQLYEDVKQDRRAIQKFKREGDIRKKYLETLKKSKDLKKAWQKIKDELNEYSLGNVSRNPDELEEFKYWNCNCNEINQMTDEEKAKEKGILHSLEDWTNMVEFWYSIRNNLFHGAKTNYLNLLAES